MPPTPACARCGASPASSAKRSCREVDRRYLQFAERFERGFVTQEAYENRDLAQTLDRGWQRLAPLPDSELTRVTRELIERYRKRPAAAPAARAES